MHVISMDLQLFHNRCEVYWLCSTSTVSKLQELFSSLVNVGGGHLWDDLLSPGLSVLRAECEAAVQQPVFKCE